MAFEIVDGMTGTKHISSDDLSALNIATIGESNCVLNYGDNFKLTMASANSATLGTGVGMVGGKRFWNQAATSLTVQSGTQGQKRNDLVVARYAKTSAGIESITPVVIKGTPTTGTAADPEVTANDLKLWRVPLDGISVGEPVKLFEPVASLATLGDSVSRAPRVFVGNKIVNFNNETYTTLWDKEGFEREFERSFDNSRDSVYAMNGDASYDFMVSGVNFYPRDGRILVAISGAHTGPFRVNYIVALGQHSVSRNQFRLGSSIMYYVEGGVCIVSADFLSVPVANSSYRLGTLPNGIKPLGQAASDQTGSNDAAYIAQLRYRGDNSAYGQIAILNSGEITAYVNKGWAYYYGQLIFPVTRSQHSVSQSEWAYLYGEPGTAGSFVRYRRDGARCVLQWGATQSTSAYWAAGNLPEQMRPADGNVYVPGACVSPNGFVENICAYCYVSASTGEVCLQVATTTNRNVRNCGETSWFI